MSGDKFELGRHQWHSQDPLHKSFLVWLRGNQEKFILVPRYFPSSVQSTSWKVVIKDWGDNVGNQKTKGNGCMTATIFSHN